MLRLEAITAHNGNSICQLSVKEAQRDFVASNRTSLAEAQTALSGGGHAYPFGIYDEDLPVGFLLIGFGTDEHWENPPAIAQNNYNIWRLMIDVRYQGKGYGKQIVTALLKQAFELGATEVAYDCFTQNVASKRLALSCGFAYSYSEEAELMKNGKKVILDYFIHQGK